MSAPTCAPSARPAPGPWRLRALPPPPRPGARPAASPEAAPPAGGTDRRDTGLDDLSVLGPITVLKLKLHPPELRMRLVAPSGVGGEVQLDGETVWPSFGLRLSSFGATTPP